jgi:hypothetical protein
VTRQSQAKASRATCSGVKATAGHFPRVATIRNQIEVTKHTAARIVPLALVMSAGTICPLVNRLQDVVMPHAGQGKPNKVWIVQGPNPVICWCVPIPEGSGFSEKARASGAIMTLAAKINAIRHRRLSFASFSNGATRPSGWREGG